MMFFFPPICLPRWRLRISPSGQSAKLSETLKLPECLILQLFIFYGVETTHPTLRVQFRIADVQRTEALRALPGQRGAQGAGQ